MKAELSMIAFRLQAEAFILIHAVSTFTHLVQEVKEHSKTVNWVQQTLVFIPQIEEIQPINNATTAVEAHHICLDHVHFVPHSQKMAM